MEALTALDHSRLPSVANATLPVRYEAARAALAECSSIDECKEWADKTAALASYAKQADDDELYKMARRIQGRAVRRCGELLRAYQTGPKGGSPPSNGGGTSPVSQREAAEAAGMSEYQEKTARRVASVPEDQFDEAVEADSPATVTALAEMGKKQAPRPDGFNESIHVMGALERFVEKCEAHTPGLIVNGMPRREWSEAIRAALCARLWLDDFVTLLEGEEQ